MVPVSRLFHVSGWTVPEAAISTAVEGFPISSTRGSNGQLRQTTYRPRDPVDLRVQLALS